MAFSLLEVTGLSLDSIARALEKATGQIASCVDEVLEQQHMMANSRVHLQDFTLTQDRLDILREVQALMVQAKEKLRRL